MSPSTPSKSPDLTATDPMSPARLAAAAALMAAATAMADPVAARPASGGGTPAQVSDHLTDLQLAGQGKLTWFGFHVYDAALYASSRFAAADPAAHAFVLELTYARRLDGKSIAEASRDEIARLGFGTEAQRGRWHEQMLAIFPDVQRGRRLAGVNLPGTGARFYFDDQFIGAVDDPDFARAFFAIWLDERTRAPQLRDSLLKSAPAAATGT